MKKLQSKLLCTFSICSLLKLDLLELRGVGLSFGVPIDFFVEELNVPKKIKFMKNENIIYLFVEGVTNGFCDGVDTIFKTTTTTT